MIKNKILKKIITTVFFIMYTTEIFANTLMLDPNSKYNTKLDSSETGVPIVNISTPNRRGISVNEFLEYHVGKEGQVLNNADNVGRSHLAGLMNANPNLGPHQAANLIVLQVNGSNRSQIEGYLEALSRKKVNVILSNENGIYLNHSGTINIEKFTATTGKVKLKDGDLIGIDVEKGNIAIGPKGFDATKTDYVEILAKTLELTGNIVAGNRLNIVAGSNKIDSASPTKIAIDASNLGGMYANTITIISTEKGAGVNSDAFIVSKNNKLEITADGKVKVNKVQGKGIDVKAQNYEQTGLAQSDLDIKVKADNIKLSGAGTQAEQEITLDGKVENSSAIYTKGNLYTKDLKNTGDIQVLKDIHVDGSVSNSKTIEAAKVEIKGDYLTNTSNILADTIKATVNHVKNDGEIVVLHDIAFQTKKLENTKKIAALETITANHTALVNSGEMVSNKKIEINHSDVTNSNKILSNTIEMKNANNFNNTGTIKGTDVILTTKNDINLVANLHGENSLEIVGNNIVNNGNTTGNNFISITANDFTNQKELSSKDLKINASGDVFNENILSAETVKINAKNVTNHDLIAAEKDLAIHAKNQILNKEGNTVYAGDTLYIQANKIVNESGEMLGKNVRLEADYILNHTGTLQALNNLDIKSARFENIGKVEDLDKYERYYETWDGHIMEAKDIGEWTRRHSDSSSKRSSGSAGRTIRRRQRKAFESIVKKVEQDKYESLLFPKYKKLMEGYLGNSGHHTEETGSAKIQEIPLKEKVRSLGKTTHAKVLAGNNIAIVSDDVFNKDAIISAENTVKIDTDKVENLVSVGEKVKVKTGQEKMFIKYERTGKRPRKKVRMEVTYTRDFANDYVTKRVQKLDEKGNPVYRNRFGRKRPVYETVKEYVGKYAYVTGEASVIEGKQVSIENASLVKQDIEEANGYVKTRNDIFVEDFTNKNVNTGTSQGNPEVKTEIVRNLDSIQEILKTGKINTIPNLPSSLFIQNVEPSAKYVMETRMKHISLSNYYGSDYFLNKVGYEEKWDRVKRLGDAFYENQLVERSIIEKLGTRFLNGKAISMKQLIENAEEEAKNLNLTIGTALTKEQIAKLDKDIVWYEYQDVNAFKVLVPKVYLSRNTLANISSYGRNRISGTEQTYIKAKNVDNTAVIGKKGTTYIEADTIMNRSIGNQIAEMTGDKTSLVAERDIFNIGSKISATDELNLIAKNGDILNKSTVVETNYDFGEFNRTRHSELENIAEISSGNQLNMIVDNYTSIAGKTSAKDLKIAVKEDVNISSQKLSGEQKFGKDGSNFHSYAFESNIGSHVNAEKINVDAKNLNIIGSAVLGKEAVFDVETLKIDSNVDKVDTESRTKTKGFLSSKSKVEMQHREDNVASTLYVEEKAIINGDVDVVGSNLFLGNRSYINGKLSTDSKATYNKYFLEEKKKGFSFDVSKNGFMASYGKTQFNYDEKDKTNIKSNLVLGDGTVLNQGADITATNFKHGDIEVNHGDVLYGSRKDERDVETSTKSSGISLSVRIKSPALDRVKQGIDSLKQMKSGDILGGIASSTNTVTGVVNGLASNQGIKLPISAVNKDNTVGKKNLKAAQATNNFYANIGVNLGFHKSSSKTSSHNESAIVTTIQGKDENSSITYNYVKNIDYVGTQVQNTKFIYNAVENINKSAVELNNSYSSSSKSSGISTGVTIGYGDGVQAEANAVSISASKSKMNSNGTTYQNGRFVDVNEVHNNTKNMILSGFHQEGGTVTGNIENLTMESKQNISTTKGSTTGGSLSISPSGMPSGSVNDSKTKGERKVVDTPTTFIIGDGSHLKVGKVENTAGAIGTTGSGKLSIEEYVGHNLENVDKSKTKGGSVGISTTGISSIGLEYSDRKQEGITKNTVIGNVEIGKSYGDEINKDLASMTEVTKNKKFETNIQVEAQTIDYVKNHEKFKEDIEKAKNEIHDIYHTVDSTVNPKGKESRNVFEQLGEVRQARTINNVIASRLEIAKNKEDITKVFEGVSKDLGYPVKVIYTDPSNSPQLIGIDKDGNMYVKNGTAYVDEKTGIHHILINSKSEGNKTKAGLIGTIAEEQSHVIGKIEGRQKKVPDGSEKGLENLGRPTNDFFKEQYHKNDQVIEVVSDGKDYSNTNFGEHVGDHLDPSEEYQYYSSKEYMKNNGNFEVIVSPKKGESEAEAITNGNYKRKPTDDFLYAQEGENPEGILNLSSQAEKLSKSDPDNNYIVTVSREEGINIIAVPKPKSWKDNLSHDFMKAKGTVAKYYRKSQDNWKNGKYLSWAGNRIVSGVSLLNLIQTGIGTTGAQQLYKFTPGEVQYGKVEDILSRRARVQKNAKGLIDNSVSAIASAAIPNKIGGGSIKIPLPETAQVVVEVGEAVGVAEKVITLPALGTGGAKAMLIASAVGSGSSNSEKNDKSTTETSKNNSKAIKQKELDQEIKSFEEISKGKSTQIDTRNIGAKETTKNAIEIKVTKDKMKEIEKISKEGDPSGIKTEKVFDSVLKDQPNVKVYDGKIGSNNGFDHIYVLEDGKGGIKEVWIVDSKQMGSTKRLKEGAVKLNNNATKLGNKSTRQLSSDWIDTDLAKLSNDNPVKTIVKKAKDNGTLRTGVVAVNKESKKLMFIEVNVKNK